MRNFVRESKKKIVKQLIKHQILVSPEFIDNLNQTNTLTDVKKLLKEKIPEQELEKVINEFSSLFENEVSECYNKDSQKDEFDRRVEVLFDYDKVQKKKKLEDFVSFFKTRFKFFEKLLSSRTELQGKLLPIHRILGKKDNENVSVIGMVMDKKYSNNQNLIFTIEDLTGTIKVVITQKYEDVFEEAKDIVCDEVVAFSGMNGDNIIFGNKIIWPDIPNTKEMKKAPEEAYAIFLSDMHVGSKEFLDKDFDSFISWINGNTGNQKQKEIAEKIKYVFIAGDMIAGVGIYPGQDEDLVIKDLYEQYERCAELLKRIPKRISIIVSPGNHDALRLAEPQPKLYCDYAKSFYDMENVFLVSNPAIVNIHKDEDFPGFNVLIYHGYSFDYYVKEVESIRNNGGYDRADLIMKFLLKRRHLAPTHGSTLYVPDLENDSHIIKTLPDFFITGHVHRCKVANYNNITTICGSCWEGKTAFQEKTGHNPEPGRVPIVNLQNRKVKILKFTEDEDE